MHRTLALVERELRKFRRNPMFIVFIVLSPLLQLVVLGYAFGGTVHDLKIAVVDQDHGLPALRIRELSNAVTANARTFEAIPYADEAVAIEDLRQGKVNAVLSIPPGFSRRVLAREDPHVALVQNNTDRVASAALAGSVNELLVAYGAGRAPTASRVSGEVKLDIVEVFPFVPYIQYLLPGNIVLAIYTMVMLGGAFSFIDDKSKGLHESYLVTPVTKLEMVAGFNISGALKAVTAGFVLMVVGSVIAGIPNPFEPVRLLKMALVISMTALALVSMMFMLMARVSNIMVPRIVGTLLSTLLYFPSGAVYPTQAFPPWMRALASVDPFTYAVHALRSLLLQNVGLAALATDLGVLAAFTAVSMAVAASLFRRTL